MTPDTVRVLAAAAGLPLGPGRDAIVAGLLAVWLPAANELSLKMSAAEHQDLLPVTVFAHLPPDEEGC
ncbi:MAG: hypothetical protein JSR59_23705 [Proteobacteria bacterium]|nr:hypothetical protein [Pseudomonadota bacterium]